MLRNIGLLQAFLLPTLLTASMSVGDEQESEPITVQESPNLYNQIDGSIEPEKIPYFLKYAIFVHMYNGYRDQLVQELSPRDDAILNALSIGTDNWEVSENDRYGREFLNLCINKSKMDAVTLARESERIAAESNARGADRYRQAIESLSTAGRENVERFVEETITPKLSLPLTDSVDFALEDPDSFMYNLEISCHIAINGEPPPGVQRMEECFRQQMGLEPDSASSESSIGSAPNPQNLVRPELADSYWKRQEACDRG